MPPEIGIVVTARNEADCLPQTLTALAGAFPGASVVVADDGSSDATPDVARDAGADVVRSERPVGKGGAATRGAERLLAACRRKAAAFDKAASPRKHRKAWDIAWNCLQPAAARLAGHEFGRGAQKACGIAMRRIFKNGMDGSPLNQ